MVLPIIIGILALIFLLPKLIEAFPKSQDKTQEQLTQEKEEEIKRGEKGAGCNTVDFIFGEGTCEDVFGSEDPDADKEKKLDDAATKTADNKPTLDGSTDVSKGEAIDPDLTDEEIISGNNQQQTFRKRQFR